MKTKTIFALAVLAGLSLAVSAAPMTPVAAPMTPVAAPATPAVSHERQRSARRARFQQRQAEAARWARERREKLGKRFAAQATEAKVFEKDGHKLLYRFHAPKAVKPGAKYPLVILMHGAGERGNDNISQLLHGADQLLGYAAKTGEELFFIAGQVPAGARWVEHPWEAKAHAMDARPASNLALLFALVDKSMAELPIDPARVYVTGISMGGYGTWEAVQRRPDLFAAAMPICGGGDTACAAKIKDVPIWCFHGDADHAVPVTRSRDMYNAVKALGGNIQYREYPGVGHDCWTATYKDDAVLAWFFSQRKGAAKK